MLIPNMVIKFNNFDVFYKFVNVLTCRLHSPAAWEARWLDSSLQKTQIEEIKMI